MNCALIWQFEKSLYYDARSEKHQIIYLIFCMWINVRQISQNESSLDAVDIFLVVAISCFLFV